MIGTPTLIGNAVASDGANTVAMTVSGGGAAVGDLVIVAIGNDGGPNMPSGVTDSKGNTYAAAEPGMRLADNYAGRVYTSVITTALVNGDTITGTVNGGGGTWDKFCTATKVSGSWDANHVDQVGQATQTSTQNWSSGASPTTTVADELIFGLGLGGSGGGGIRTSTVSSPLAEIADNSNSSWIAYTTAYRIVSATGAYTVNGSFNVALTNIGGIVVTLKEAATPTPSITGTPIEINNAANSGSQTVTVPADATGCVVFVCGYQGTINYFNTGTLTLDGVAFSDPSPADTDTSVFMGCLWWLPNPTPGDKTLAWDWAGSTAPNNGVILVVVFLTDTDESGTALRDSDVNINSNSANYTTPTLTAQAGDLILAFGHQYNDTGRTFSWTGATKVADYKVGSGGYNNASCSLATATPTGNQTVTFTSGTSTDGGVSAFVIKYSEFVAGPGESVAITDPDYRLHPKYRLRRN